MATLPSLQAVTDLSGAPSVGDNNQTDSAPASGWNLNLKLSRYLLV